MAFSSLSIYLLTTKIDELRRETEKKEEELYKEIGKLSTQLEWLLKKSGLKPPF